MNVFIRFTTVLCILGVFRPHYAYGSPPNIAANPAQSSVTMTAVTGSDWRWRDIARNPYSNAYQAAYSYSSASVTITYNSSGQELRGHLSATGLKPNFAYQLKLNEWDVFPREQYEQIGYSGRWWQEQWDATNDEWVNGQNLNNKGDGSFPNPNDTTYDSRKDITDSDPENWTGYYYKYSTYRVFAYFVTDGFGSAEVDFAVNSSYHVLWKTTQPRSWDVNKDGVILNHTLDPDPLLHTAYDTDYGATTVGVFGEWERLPNARIPLAPGDYDCQFALTEESFHEYGYLDGGWALAMLGDVQFTITSGSIQATVSQTESTVYPDTPLGTSEDLTLTFLNTGDAALSLLGSPSATLVAGDVGQFSIVTQPTNVLIYPNASTSMTVRYTPTSIGEHTVTVRVPTNDPTAPNFDVVLVGKCVSNISQLTGPSRFPDTFVGTKSKKIYTITNLGSTTLTLTGSPLVYLVGDSAQFNVSTMPASTIAPGGTATFTVSYAPNEAGRHSLDLLVPTSDPLDPVLELSVTARSVLYDEPDRDDWRDPSKCGLQQTEEPLPFYVLLGLVLLVCMLARVRAKAC